MFYKNIIIGYDGINISNSIFGEDLVGCFAKMINYIRCQINWEYFICCE